MPFYPRDDLMSKETKKVSIIIPNYNGERFIPHLFKTLCEQTYKKFEVIFVDNASTDHSLMLLENLLKKSPYNELNVRIIRNAVNLGFCQGNNIGLQFTHGKYVVFLNNDTYVSAKLLEKLVKVMDTHSSVGVCQSRIIWAQTGDIQTDGWLLDRYLWAQGLVFNKSKSTISKIPFYASGASMIIRRLLLIQLGGFDQELFCGDYDLCWRLRLCGYDVATSLKSKCYHYGGIATNTLVPQIKLTFHSHQEMVRVFLKNYSTRNVIKRISQFMTLLFGQATYLSLKYKNPLYLVASFRALAWNLRKLSDTLLARSRVQRHRKVSDREIEDNMIRYCVLLSRRRIA